ncbi:MAG: hypothetical protein B7Y56_14725 [Gallionellales bacterium 35-53-114]|nr:MAG: hypothetical protein B7Y56_14725 [Gallionellales bacterium 35-53-114]OYZ63326.1 MAG: hypothetical protein B7Y04_10670 [Gallionellales bacterium 24-53-125]OZB08789.1 MAG: hypothetical protein B7X61_09760 [Gallionellales bacterium 39-52-133]
MFGYTQKVAYISRFSGPDESLAQKFNTSLVQKPLLTAGHRNIFEVKSGDDRKILRVWAI